MSDEASDTGRITEIRDQVRDPERVNVFIDGVFRFGLPRITVADRNLQVGQLLTEQDIAELETVDEIERATNRAVRLLAHRPRSRFELDSRLRRAGFRSDAVRAAVDRMVDLGYIDDRDFAAYWIENRQQHRPRGRRMIVRELREKGISPDVIDQVMDDAEIDEYPEALELARKRAGRMQDLERDVWRRRLAGFLQRRGYAMGVVWRVLDELEQSEQD